MTIKAKIKCQKQIYPKSNAIVVLRAAGRCEFEGCNKILYEGDITKEYGNFGELCHIIGDSPNGPRGGEKSESLAQDINNIILFVSCLS
mgnify:CR=1 FL=1